MLNYFKIILVFCLVVTDLFSQKNDSLSLKSKYNPKISAISDSNIIFSSKKHLIENDTLQQAKLNIGGYVSSYFAYYDDDTEQNGFVQFPTMAARNKQFGLNMALIDMQYVSKNIRSNLGIHFGDIPQSVWSKQYNVIQEANAGIKLIKHLWFDAGFFRSHIGVESSQPRENITSSMTLVNFYEPYFLAGMKLTYEVNSKLSIQVNSFNSLNSFVDNNKNKFVGTSIVYQPTNNLSLTYNFITGTETPDSVKTKQQRYYNNFYLTYTSAKILIAAEANYGLQTHSLKSDLTKNASMYSGLIVLKYQAIKKFAVYGREEFFSDYNQILTGATNISHSVYGTTAGFEYKPFTKVALSLEGRLLQSENLIFVQGNKVTNYRNELIFCLDVWF